MTWKDRNFIIALVILLLVQIPLSVVVAVKLHIIVNSISSSLNILLLTPSMMRASGRGLFQTCCDRGGHIDGQV